MKHIHIYIHKYEGRVLYHMSKPSFQSDPSINTKKTHLWQPFFLTWQPMRHGGGGRFTVDTPRNLTATLW